jgi:hypothetical protein
MKWTCAKDAARWHTFFSFTSVTAQFVLRPPTSWWTRTNEVLLTESWQHNHCSSCVDNSTRNRRLSQWFIYQVLVLVCVLSCENYCSSVDFTEINPTITDIIANWLTNKLTNFTEWIHSWEADSYTTSPMPLLLWNPKVHYRVHKSPQPVPILNSLKNPCSVQVSVLWVG